MSKVVLVFCLCVVLPFAEPAPKNSKNADLIASLQSQYLALSSLPVRCAQDIQTQLWTEGVNSFRGLANCSIAGIVKNVAYILIDTADYGNETWNDVWDIVDNVVQCEQETAVLDEVKCALMALSNSSVAFENFLQMTVELIGNMQDIVPAIVGEVEKCVEKNVKQFELALEDLTEKSKSCS